RICRPFRLLRGERKRVPFVVPESSDRAPPVNAFARIDAMRSCPLIAVRFAMVVTLIQLCLKNCRREELNSGFVLRQIDMLPCACSLAMIQGGENGDEAKPRGNEIDVRPIQKHRLFRFSVSGEMCESAHRRQLRAKAPLSGASPGLSLVA